MSDSTLSEEQALTLLRKLATDDEFRTRFIDKPAKALTEIGLAPETVLNLSGACLTRRELASKEAFQNAVDALDKDVIYATMTMITPKLAFPG
ncbi:MAG: NHLP-related RiPP peptide [Dokdonella sp.]